MSEAQPRKRPARQRRHRTGLKTKLPTIAALDKRTRSAAVVLELRSELISDQGGEANLSAAKRQAIDRAAVTGAMLEALEVNYLRDATIDIGEYTTLLNTHLRYLSALGFSRQSRNITPRFDQLLYEDSVAA